MNIRGDKMKVLVAMDEFNGIISSQSVCKEAVASQIEKADIVQVPLFNGRHELMDSVFYGNQVPNTEWLPMMQI